LAVRDDWHGEGNQVVDRRAVIGVAAVAAVVSYEHAYSLIRAHGETGWTAHLIQVTVDGLIWASSMFMLDSARSGVRVSALARWPHGLGHGLIGSAIAAIRARAPRGQCRAHARQSQFPGWRLIRFRSGPLRSSPTKWRRVPFLRSARFGRGFMYASLGRSMYAHTYVRSLTRPESI
jgi:hypothetical protein